MMIKGHLMIDNILDKVITVPYSRHGIDLYHADCLKLLPSLPDKSADLIICDPPYNISSLKWDRLLDWDKVFKELLRIVSDNGTIAVFSIEPLASQIRIAGLKYYKYDWVWHKCLASNFLAANYQPLRVTENILIFSKAASSYSPRGSMRYYPQLTEGVPYNKQRKSIPNKIYANIRSDIQDYAYKNHTTRHPVNLLKYPKENKHLHPTQKPLDLMRYLISTYTLIGGNVLDPCMGSGRDALAALQLGRHFVGIELDSDYFVTAINEVENYLNDK